MNSQAKIDGRAERSRRTRGRVIDAATQRFIDHGYVAATIGGVAEAAGVAVQTVYYLFGNKRTLLAAVLDASIAGDLEPVPIVERPFLDEVRNEPDATAALTRLVAETVTIVARAAPIYEVIRRASADPEVGALLEENRRLRREGQRELMAVLHRSGHLRPDVTLDSATDIYFGIMNEEVLQLLVGGCGWDVERFRRWTTTLMLRELIHADNVAG